MVSLGGESGAMYQQHVAAVDGCAFDGGAVFESHGHLWIFRNFWENREVVRNHWGGGVGVRGDFGSTGNKRASSEGEGEHGGGE